MTRHDDGLDAARYTYATRERWDWRKVVALVVVVLVVGLALGALCGVVALVVVLVMRGVA